MSCPADEERPREFLTSPLVALAACFALGIVAADPQHTSLPDTIRCVPWLLAGAAVFMLAGLILVRARREALAWVLALAGFVLAGVIAQRLFEFRFSPHHVSHLQDLGIDLNDAVRLTGRLVSSPLEIPSGTQFDLDLESLEDRSRSYALEGKVRLRMRRAKDVRAAAVADSLRLRYGDSIRVLAELERPRVYRDPGVFDFRQWMESVEDISWAGTIKSPLLVEKLPRQGLPGPDVLLDRVRLRLLAGIDRMYPAWSPAGRAGAVLKAALLGDRASLDTDTMENFQRAGLYHLLVISGLHVGLLAMLATLLVRLLPLGEGWRSGLVLLFLLGYCSLVELRAPTLRATIMITAYLAARFYYREHAALNAVGLAALVLLLHRPPWLFDSGFEFSFAAALLIVGLVAPILERTTEPYRRALRNVRDADIDLRFSPRYAQLRLDVRRVVERVEARRAFLKNHPAVAAAAVTLPLRAFVWTVNILLFTTILQVGLTLPMAAIFHRVTYAGIGLNALAIPLMTVLLGLAVPTVLLSVVSAGLAAWPAKVLALVMTFLFKLTDLPLPAWLSYRVPTPPVWVGWGFACSVVVAAWAFARHKRTFWAATAGLALFASLISLDPFPPRFPAGRLEITALDCGGGDAAFVVLPDRTTLLYGACEGRARANSDNPLGARRWDAGENIVSPYLWSRGVKKIDVLVMGHGSKSQLAGFAAIARNFTIGEIWHGANAATPAVLAFLDELEYRGTSVRGVSAGYRIARQSASVEILWPPARGSDEVKSARASEDDSVALRISDGGASVFIPGDAGGKVNPALLDSRILPESSVLVLGNPALSGALTPEFVARLKPRVVVLSGEGTSPKHSPRDALPPALLSGGARLYRTDLEGAVTVEMSRAGISVHTYRMPAGDGAFVPVAAGTGESSSKVR